MVYGCSSYMVYCIRTPTCFFSPFADVSSFDTDRYLSELSSSSIFHRQTFADICLIYPPVMSVDQA